MSSVSNRARGSGDSADRSRLLPERAWRRDTNLEEPERGSLHEFLQGYEHIAIEDACKEKPIGPRDLAVWVNRTGVWTQLDVKPLWGKKRVKESLCRRLVTGLLGLSDAQYESMKDAFEDPDGSELIGLYRNDAMKYAIVVRMPKDNKALLGLGAAAIGLGSGALGFFSRGAVSVTTEAKWADAVDKFIQDANLFSALYGLERDVLLNPENPFYEANGREVEKRHIRAMQYDLDALRRAMFLYRDYMPNPQTPALVPSKIQELITKFHGGLKQIITPASNNVNKEGLVEISQRLENDFNEIERLKWFVPINANYKEHTVYGYREPQSPADTEMRKLSQWRLYLFAQLLPIVDKLFQMYAAILKQREQSTEPTEIASIKKINKAMEELYRSYVNMHYGLKLANHPRLLSDVVDEKRFLVMEGVREIEEDLASKDNVAEMQELVTAAKEIDIRIKKNIPEGGLEEGSSAADGGLHESQWNAAVDEFFKNGYLLFALRQMKGTILDQKLKLGKIDKTQHNEEMSELYALPNSLNDLHRINFMSRRDGWRPEALERFAQLISAVNTWAKKAKDEKLTFRELSVDEFSQVADAFLENVATLQRHPWLAKFAAESH